MKEGIGYTLKDFISLLNSKADYYVNFYYVYEVGDLKDYKTFSEKDLNRRIINITSPAQDYVSYIYAD